MQWAVLAFGIVFILYVTVIRPMRKAKSRPDPLERKPNKSTLAQQRAIERDMGNLLVQYEEMIRRMTAQVDIRATKLELLIREAEQRIAELKALTNGVNPAGTSAGSTGSTGSPQAGAPQAGLTGSPQGDPVPTPDGDAGATPAAVGDPAATPLTASSPAAKVDAPDSPDDGGAAILEARKLADGSGPAAKADERHAEIYRLADGGRTARQIAQELNRPYGEVDLILRLHSPRPRQGDLWDQPPAASPDSTPAQAEAFNPPESPAGSGDQRRKGRKKQRSTGG